MSATVSSCDQHGGGRRREEAVPWDATATVTLEKGISGGVVHCSWFDGVGDAAMAVAVAVAVGACYKN